MGEHGARGPARAPSKTSWARPGPGPFDISGNFLQKTRPEKEEEQNVLSFGHCKSLHSFLNHMFLEPSKKARINEI